MKYYEISNFYSILSRFRKSKIAKDSAYYTLFNVLERVIPFLVLPIITRVLNKEDVGQYVYYQAIIEVLVPILTLNIDSSILLNYYKLIREEFSVYFTTGIILFILVYTGSVLLSLIFKEFLENLLSFEIEWLNIIGIIVIFRFITQLRQNLWRIDYKIKKYGSFTVSISILKNVAALLFVFLTDYGWKGLILGHLFGHFIFALYALWSFKEDKLIVFKKKLVYIRDLVKIGVPLSLHRLGIWLGNTANRIIITSIIGVAATGDYGVGATFSIIVTLIEDAFNKAFTPHLYEKLKVQKAANSKDIVKLTYLIYFILTVISFGVCIIGYVSVGMIFGKEYNATRTFLLPLIIASLFKGLYKLHVSYIIFTKKTFKITQITLTTGILNIMLAYFMISIYGLLGAAYSMLVISFLQYTLTFYVSNKLIPMPWLLKK